MIMFDINIILVSTFFKKSREKSEKEKENNKDIGLIFRLTQKYSY